MYKEAELVPTGNENLDNNFLSKDEKKFFRMKPSEKSNQQ